MNQTYMKEKKIFPLVMSMALPMMLSMAFNSLYNIVDSYFVAKLSEDAMTALSLVYPAQNLLTAVAVGFGVGVNAMISFYLGAQNQEKADKTATQGMVLGVLHGVLLMILFLCGMNWFLGMFTKSDTVRALGMEYSNVVFLFSTIVTGGITLEKIFQAVGRMRATMVSMIAGFVTNIVLDPLLIFGIGPFPRMEIAGAALATGIGQVITLLVYIIYYVLDPLPVKLRRTYLRPEGEICGKTYGIGIPATLNMALPSLLISALNGILAAYSGAYVLVLGVYYKLQTFIYLPSNGIIQGIRPLIGYNYGAGAEACGADLPVDAGTDCRDHGYRHGIVLADPRRTDRTVHRESGDCYHRYYSTAHHQSGLYSVRCVGDQLRRTGGAGTGHGFPGDLRDAVCGGDHPCGICAEPPDRRHRCVVGICLHGERDRGGGVCAVPQSVEEGVKRELPSSICTEPAPYASVKPSWHKSTGELMYTQYLVSFN